MKSNTLDITLKENDKDIFSHINPAVQSQMFWLELEKSSNEFLTSFHCEQA